jgi:hypothetical protein
VVRVSRIAGGAPRQPFGLALVGDACPDELVLARLGRFQRVPFALFADHVYSWMFPCRAHLVNHPKCLLHYRRVSRPGGTLFYRRILAQACVKVWKILRRVSRPEGQGQGTGSEGPGGERRHCHGRAAGGRQQRRGLPAAGGRGPPFSRCRKMLFTLQLPRCLVFVHHVVHL